MYPYHVANDVWAHRHWAAEVASNDATEPDSGSSILVAPGGLCADPAPWLVVWATSNGGPSLIATCPAARQPYGGPVELNVAVGWEPEWLQAYGAPEEGELEWLCGKIWEALPREMRYEHPGFVATGWQLNDAAG